MNRREFTQNISKLLIKMHDDGHEPIIDYVLRSQAEQYRLFLNKLTKCDGQNKVSAHQYGRAADIYFYFEGKVDYDYVRTADLAEKYHVLWVSWGGKPMISWDKPHYE